VAGGVRGAEDIRVERATGQQYLAIDIDRRSIARYGINVADVHDVIEMAIGGKVATQIYEGERRFEASVRLLEAFRGDEETIRKLLLPTPSGAQVTLDSLADIRLIEGLV